MDIKLNLAAEQFYEWLKVNGYRAETVKSYRKCLKKFVNYIDNETTIGSVDEITAADVFGYQTWLYYAAGDNCQPLAVGTQLNALSALKGFFRFLNETNQLAFDPTAGLKMPKRPQRLPYVPSFAEISLLFSQPKLYKPLEFRDRTIM